VGTFDLKGNIKGGEEKGGNVKFLLRGKKGGRHKKQGPGEGREGKKKNDPTKDKQWKGSLFGKIEGKY